MAAGALFPAFGIRLSPMIGSAAMSLSSVCVVTNALRLRFFKRRESGVVDPPAPAMEAGQHTPGDLPVEETEKGMETMEKVLHVEGMMCAHCKAHVEKALLGVNGVTAAEADVENKRAVVQCGGEVADEALVSAVKEAGYEAKMA